MNDSSARLPNSCFREAGVESIGFQQGQIFELSLKRLGSVCDILPAVNGEASHTWGIPVSRRQSHGQLLPHGSDKISR